MTIDCCVTLGNEREKRYGAGRLLRDMDKAGVDMAVIAPLDSEIAVFNRRGNARILKAATRHRDRLIPACAVTPWSGKKGLEELERAIGEGSRMLILHPGIQGFLPTDELVFPLVETAAGRLPVYVHTGSHLYGSPWDAAGLALRFPETTFILGHAGATDYWNDVPTAARSAPNLYIEGSLARPFTFRNHLLAVGADRGIMGSYAPTNDLVFEWRWYREHLCEPEFEPVFGGNLAALLGIGGERP
jgi:predicted TIM-barrel fold metal-dependent hydrolase